MVAFYAIMAIISILTLVVSPWVGVPLVVVCIIAMILSMEG